MNSTPKRIKSEYVELKRILVECVDAQNKLEIQYENEKNALEKKFKIKRSEAEAKTRRATRQIEARYNIIDKKDDECLKVDTPKSSKKGEIIF